MSIPPSIVASPHSISGQLSSLTLQATTYRPLPDDKKMSIKTTATSNSGEMPPRAGLLSNREESGFTRSMKDLAISLKKLMSMPASISGLSGSENFDQRIIIHLMRHAQAEHNLAHLHGRNRADYPDPELTTRGIKQCQKAMDSFPYMDEISIILSSPLRRTMQTALYTFQPLYARGLKLILWSALREWGNGASNIGSTVTEMQEELANLPVDLRLLNEGWELETDPEEEGAERSNRVRKDLFDLGEILQTGGVWKGIPMDKCAGPVHIMVVSHGGFLANLMWADAALRNTGCRSFAFASEEQVSKGVSKYRLFEITGEAKP